MTFGNGIGYLCIVGDNVPPVLKQFIPSRYEGTFVESRQFPILVGAALIVVPFASLRNLHSTRFLSTFAIAMIMYMFLVVCLFAFSPKSWGKTFDPTSDECELGGWDLWLPESSTWIDVAKMLPLFVFGFTCHQNIFSICSELKRPSQKRFNYIIAGALMFAILIYASFASIGFYIYGTDMKPDLLTCLPKKSLLVDFARVGISLNVLLSYPLQLQPCRDSLSYLL